MEDNRAQGRPLCSMHPGPPYPLCHCWAPKRPALGSKAVLLHSMLLRAKICVKHTAWPVNSAWQTLMGTWLGWPRVEQHCAGQNEGAPGLQVCFQASRVHSSPWLYRGALSQKSALRQPIPFTAYDVYLGASLHWVLGFSSAAACQQATAHRWKCTY